MGQGTVLGAGSVPDLRERWGRAQCLVLEERWGKAQCLVLEVCLTTERDGARHSAWCWKCASPWKERQGRAQCLVLEVCLTAERERDGAGHSAWCWKCA